tara:strand:- start:426 stop:1559 length:1134 start_codon:yes stop_codon:yes gene_type:complete
MAVLPKYQLKLLFESGDLITQDTLSDLIDATYNPSLVAGTNVTLNTVTTPSGTTITVNATGGGSGVVTSLTTTGTSGPATLNTTTGVLNIPVYGGGVGSYTNLTPTPQPFPGNSPFDNIAAGTTFNNQTFEEMMNKMLYPTLTPTLTNPSSTFVLSQAGFREVNETTPLNFSSTFNRGSISPAYSGGPSNRSGLPNTYNYTGTGVSSNSSTSLSDSESVGSYTVLQGSQSWTGSVSYDAGQQPLDSVGGNFGSPLPAGTTSAITRTITGVYPVFATTSSLGVMTKQSLQGMTTNITVDVVTESGGGGAKQKIDIPNAWSTITGVQQFNTLSGTFDTINLSTFTQSAVTQTIQGAVVNYTRFTHNGATIGARKLRFLT